MDEQTTMVPILRETMVQDLGGGIYRVDGDMVAGAPRMLAAVSSALGIQPKPRAPRKEKKSQK